MKTFRTFLLIVTFAAVAPLCQARLGETETKCDVRYNPEAKKVEPSSHDKNYPLTVGQPLDTITYGYQGWSIRIGFLEGIACCMEYTKGNSRKPDGAEIEAILKANEMGGTWQRISAEQAKTNAVLKELWSYAGAAPGGFWLRRDGSIAYVTAFGFGNTLRMEHKKAVDIGIKHIRDRETAKKEPVPKF